MKKNILQFFPIIIVMAIEVLAFSRAGQIQSMVTMFSGTVAALIVLTGLLPALLKPQPTHTLIACFAIIFAFFLLVPFELSDLPSLRPGQPLYQFINAHLFLRLANAAILLPMAVHVSARFPIRTDTSARVLVSGYGFSIFLLTAFLFSSLPWQRILTIVLLFLWFTVVIFFFFRNLFAAARDTHPDHASDAQRARVVMFSLILAEIPLWLRPLMFALGLDIFPYNLLLLFQLFVPAGITYAILRHDLFGIDRTLRRALIYGAGSLILLTLYLFLTSSITSLFAHPLTSRPLATVVSLFISALLFEPTLKWIQTGLDKLLYPDRLKFQAAVQSMQILLGRANRREEIIHLLNDIFPNQIGAKWGTLKLFPEPDVAPVNLTPAWHIRLVAGSVSVGGYWLGARRAGPVYESDERYRLSALMGQAALALAYANAYESLYELNQNLEMRVREQTEQTIADQKFIAAHEERQRIARDLHDSVTQSIFGINLMARGLKTSAPDSFKSQLAELESMAGDVLKEMRLLLDQLRNANGDANVNFAESVHGLCETLSLRSGPEGGQLLAIALEMPNDLFLPNPIAEEALLILREGLQNIIKHSGSRAAKVEVKKDTRLHVLISDDGIGFDASTTPPGHYGLRGMRERVLALGGEFYIDSKIGAGTTFSFNLPLPR
jgi:two-component system sensor histidine kinase DegS